MNTAGLLSSAHNFPLWTPGGLSGGLLIAAIAVIHVFVAQFAVGGGFFLVMAEAKGHREGSARILKWVHRHTRFFLLLTMVFGGLTGVGIWLIISLVSPGGTSVLIREFMYAWAAEWVFFLGEIVALLLYAASFARCREGRMAPRDHLILGGAYALFSFGSLFIINGILTFMLTPGDWLQTGDFWSALFNPGFWPSLVFRFGLCLLLAGLFGLLTATGVSDAETREELVRFCAQWVCLPFFIMVAGGVWYLWSLPDEITVAMRRRTDDIRPFVRAFLDTAPLLFLAGMFLFVKMPRRAYRPYVVVAMLFGLIVAGSFEWVRETARRPWLIRGFMYSNGITVPDARLMNEKGVAAANRWVLGVPPHTGPRADGTPAQGDAAPAARPSGRLIFAQQCGSCHGIGAPMLDIKPRVAGRGVEGINALLAAQGVISPYMPPFAGLEQDRRILAEWLARLETE